MIGLVTIGQSPRNDVVQSMFQTPPPVIFQAGALDKLTIEQIGVLSPQPGEQSLVSVLRDGREVTLSKVRIMSHLQRAISIVEQQGAGTICVLCTGSFGRLHSNARLIFPDHILRGVIDVLLPEGALGVLMPERDQASQMAEKWSGPTRTLLLESASPYTAASRISMGVQTLVDQGADIILMDCMGYTRSMQSAARSNVDVPVLLSSGLVGSVLAELVGATEFA